MANYRILDGPLQIINRECIALRTNESIVNSDALKQLLDQTITFMKDADALFATLFSEVFYGGSYFDDLKIGKPNEYDIDFKLRVPRKCEKTNARDSCTCLQVLSSNKPGFFWFKLNEDHCSSLRRFIRDGYVQTDLIFNWFKGLATRALNHNTMVRAFTQETRPVYDGESGPAVTLGLYTSCGYMTVDLVPAFWFDGNNHWPPSPYKANPSTRHSSFLLVPKKPRNMVPASRFWRASFQEQERELISGRERLKPALRLLKKMRDSLQHSRVSSYALKSIVLRNVDSFRSSASLGDVFVTLLKQYRDSLAAKEVPYYWNRRSNLLEGMSDENIRNHCNEISRKIEALDRRYRDDPWVVAELILNTRSEEYERIRARFVPNVPPPLRVGFGGNEGGNEDGALNQAANGWGTAETVVAVGAAVIGVAAVLGAFFRNNRD